MKKTAITLFVVLALTLGIALLPTMTWAAEFSYAGPPAFTVTYPDSAKPDKKTSDDQVWAARTPDQLSMQAGVGPIPAGIELKDYAEKSYKPGLESAQKTKVKMKTNKEYDLAGGTKAYYSEMEWMFQGQTMITTVIVTAYKDGKYVCVSAHPWQDIDEGTEIVQSLKFK